MTDASDISQACRTTSTYGRATANLTGPQAEAALSAVAKALPPSLVIFLR